VHGDACTDQKDAFGTLQQTVIQGQSIQQLEH